MAETKESKIVLEREYNVPLRRGFGSTPRYRRSKKATTVLREFIQKHMKSTDVRIGTFANENIWKDGIKNPPHHIAVIAKKNDEGTVFVEYKNAPAAPAEVVEEKKPSTDKKAAVDADASDVAEKKADDKPAPAKEAAKKAPAKKAATKKTADKKE